MNLRSEILAEHSKVQAEKIIQWVGKSQKRMDELVQLFLHDEYRVVQRAAWPISYIAAAHPQLVEKHLPILIQLLHSNKQHPAVRRNILRLFQTVPIPETFHGEMMDLCFGFISNLQEAAAVKAFSLSVLEKLAVFYPDILPELKVIIEDRWSYESAAFHSSAKKILKKIK